MDEVKAQETFPETFVVLFPVQKKSQSKTSLNRHMKVSHHEFLAETVYETMTESEVGDYIAMALSVH